MKSSFASAYRHQYSIHTTCNWRRSISIWPFTWPLTWQAFVYMATTCRDPRDTCVCVSVCAKNKSYSHTYKIEGKTKAAESTTVIGSHSATVLLMVLSHIRVWYVSKTLKQPRAAGLFFSHDTWMQTLIRNNRRRFCMRAVHQIARQKSLEKWKKTHLCQVQRAPLVSPRDRKRLGPTCLHLKVLSLVCCDGLTDGFNGCNYRAVQGKKHLYRCYLTRFVKSDGV